MCPDANCKICGNGGVCTICKDTFVQRLDNSCNKTCDAEYYKDVNKCQKCIEGCSIC